jgi:hypothetical protein
VAWGCFHVEDNHSWQPGVIFAALVQTPRGSEPGDWEWGKNSGKSWPLDLRILGRGFFSHFGGSKWTGDHPQEEFSQIWLQVGQREKLEKFWSSTCQNAKTLSTFLFGLRNTATLGHYFQQNPLYKSQPFFLIAKWAKKSWISRADFSFYTHFFFFASERTKGPFFSSSRCHVIPRG